MADSTRRILTVAAVVAVVAALLVGVVLAGGEDDGATAQETTTSGGQAEDPRELEEQVGLARRDAEAVTAIGDEDADLVLIEYSDYRCPFCGKFARDTMPVLLEEYVETGRIRFEWRDFPVFGEESMKGAMAARAAGEQGLYWEYHDAMYADAPERGHLEITDEKIRAWAKEVGVPDMEQFTKDLDDPELRKKVDADTAEAREIGATGTPTFVLGGQIMVGAQPLEAFRDLIDEQLAAIEEQ